MLHLTGIPQDTPLALAAANASLVRSLIRRASNSATLAIIVITILLGLVVASISGRSQNTKPPMPFFSTSLASFKTKPVSRAN